jgi:hypothetical protein
MEHILQEDLSELSSRFPYENDGFDKSGLPSKPERILKTVLQYTLPTDHF